MNKISIFSLSFIYNIYFLIVNKKTFNENLKVHTLNFTSIEHDLFKQKKVQKKLSSKIFKLAKTYPEFNSVKLEDEFGNQNIESPVTKDFYRKIKNWSVTPGSWKKSANTSGSSGKPLNLVRSPRAFLNSQITFYKFFLQFGISRFDRNIYVGGARSNQVSKIKKLSSFDLYMSI